MRQQELAMLDEYNIITDTDPSEVTEGGASQAKPAGVVDPFGDTPSPITDDDQEDANGGD